MANMRVHELAKELNISSKEIIETLNNDTKTYKSVSGLGEAEISIIKNKYGKGGSVKTDNKTIENNNNEVKDTEAKTHISQVFYPQNSKNNGNDKSQNKNDGRNQDNRNNRNSDNKNGNGNVRGDRNSDNRNGQGGYRNNRNSDNRNGQGGYRNDRNSDNRNGQGGYRNDRNSDNRNGQGGYRNDRNSDNRNGQGGYRNDRNSDNRNGQGGYRNDRNSDNRNGQGGYRNDRNSDNRNGQGGYRNDRNSDNRNGQGGFRGDRNSDNRNGQGGFRGDRNSDNRNGQQRRNDRRDSAPKDDFIFETKPDSRKVDNRKDNKKNDRRKDNESKENLKFVNSQLAKKSVKKEEKEEETIKQLVLPDTLTIKELADKMKVQPSALVKKLFLQGKVVTINQEIDYDAAEEIALEYNCICEHEEKVDVIAELLKEDEDAQETLVPRPPVVCVMGHVDHGKTSLLDAIRETHVTAKESGGITQKIGAYTVDIDDHSITFLDTPGHEAFTAMRMRGAQATDIAILVVAADDGVMPQTIEAINHAKAAGVDIIVAVNKIDKPSANIEKVKQELTEYELIPEDWGGSTIFVPVSAHTKEGIDDLLEMILLTAEVHELKANPNRKARGIVIEAELDKGRGPVATILVQKGTLKVGDNVAAGACHGKIRAMIDDKGRRVKSAGPSTPVEILGLNDVPNAGEIIMSFDSDKEARSFSETFISEGRKKLLDDSKHKVSLDALFEQIQAGNMKELGIIIKADVQGSVEAVKQSLLKLSNEEVVVKIVHGGVGNINESDVVLASASNAIIIGFNVKPDNQARIVAEREKVDLRLYNVIYNAIADVESALKGMLEPIYEEQVIGHAEILQIFKASGVGNIAGAIVKDGKITKNASVRITREGEKIFEGPIATLKRFKDEVKEVKGGFECGLVFEKFGDIQEGDIVEAYEMVEVPR
jgi:translation initiation factor IF-2